MRSALKGLALSLIAAACLSAQIPDPDLTPGSTLRVTRLDVCQSGYTHRVRAVSLATKRRVFAAYGIPWSKHALYEVDHLISLELGGDNSMRNLWPEAYAGLLGARSKDALENALHRKVCAGAMSLQEAQEEIATDWISAYVRYVK